MDLWAAIRELYKERERLSKVIATLEQLQESAGAGKALKRRGRRAMGAAERREVSERMKKYWAARRARLKPSKPS
jgi:hypothetical protein